MSNKFSYSGNLSNSEIKTLVNDLSINSSREDVQTVLHQVTPNDNLDIDEFARFVFTLRRRFDLELIWSRLVDGKVPDEVLPLDVNKTGGITTAFEAKDRTLSLDAFVEFWKATAYAGVVDGDLNDRVVSETQQIFRVFMGANYLESNPRLSYDGFFKLMNSETNDAYDPHSKTLYQDMSHPLSYYYMYSSHNTYLESDQVVGKSSVNRYINDLLRGVRCVELDTWDGPEGDPIIKHGGTLTSSILFLDVIKAIKTFGFVTSPYPVVLSIENHCSLQQQRRMAIMMRGIFGDMLLDANEGYYSRSDILLESPEELKEKILVKGSRPRLGGAVEEEDEGSDFEEDDEEASHDATAPGSVTQRRPNAELVGEEETLDSYSFDSTDTNSIDETLDTASVKTGTTKSSRKKVNLKKQGSTISSVSKGSVSSKGSTSSKNSSTSSSADTMSTLNNALGLNKEKTHEFLASVTYLATCKIKSFDPKFSKTIPADHISSFRETTMEKHKRKHLKDWIEHNKTHLSRVYPNGVRIDSSNYEPIPAWSVGAQMIALNTQTHDIPNILNDGMFRQNGGCGYVLKPDYMLFSDGVKDPPCRIIINIISGQSFPKLKGVSGKPSPHVEVSVNGLDGDTVKYTTTTVHNNGFDPIWDECFEFMVNMPDLAQLTFQVINEDSIFSKQASIASGSIPLKCLRQGFRIVRLYDENGRNDFEFAFATLFVYISKEIVWKKV